VTTYYSPRIRIHDVIERAKSTTVDLTVYYNGAAVTPSAATFRLASPSNGDTIATTSATIVGSTVQYSISASEIPSTLSLSDGYMQYWTLTISGEVHTFKKPTAISLSSLYPVITDLDLEAEYSDLASIRPSTMNSYQTYLDEAWVQLIQRIRDQGNLEYLIMSPQSLRSCHKNLTFYLIFKDMDSSGLGEGRYLELAKEHRKEMEFDFKRLKFTYDQSQSGYPDDVNKQRSAVSVIYTAAPPIWYRRLR
jgi:hypothetical protein